MIAINNVSPMSERIVPEYMNRMLIPDSYWKMAKKQPTYVAWEYSGLQQTSLQEPLSSSPSWLLVLISAITSSMTFSSYIFCKTSLSLSLRPFSFMILGVSKLKTKTIRVHYNSEAAIGMQHIQVKTRCELSSSSNLPSFGKIAQKQFPRRIPKMTTTQKQAPAAPVYSFGAVSLTNFGHTKVKPPHAKPKINLAARYIFWVAVVGWD